jgi:predicted regulator of Ras-like GTPase activity (Roadblock/LC7/MglB family)
MIDQSDIDDRIAKCSKILEENPGSQVFAALADAHRKKGELDKAFRICQNGLKIHPSYGSGHLVMAKINMDKGMYDWAETEIEKAIGLEGATRTTELLLAEVHIYKGEFNKACRLLERLQRADPQNHQIAKLLDIARKIPLDADHIGAPRRVGSPAGPAVPPPTAAMTAEHPATAVTAPKKLAKGEAPPAMTHMQVLKAVATVPGIEGVLLINPDGLVAEAEWTAPGETDLMGALVAETARYCTVQMKESGFGVLHSILIESTSSLTYMVNVRDMLLAVICSPTVNLGSLKLKLASLLPRLSG